MTNKTLGTWLMTTVIVTVGVGVLFSDQDLTGFYELAGLSMLVSGIWGGMRLTKCDCCKKCDKSCK